LQQPSISGPLVISKHGRPEIDDSAVIEAIKKRMAEGLKYNEAVTATIPEFTKTSEEAEALRRRVRRKRNKIQP
jgi:hypothetical protein